MVEKCVHCGEELSPIERNRSECLDCRDKISLTASEHEEIG